MSGHSKWHNIKEKKGAADAKRAQAFTKFGNAITIAARQGGGDPTMNPRLAYAIERAKAVNVPKENIERAVKRGTGELEGGAADEVSYEGMGPAGSLFLVITATNNRNRTVSEIKYIFSKHGGSLSGPNSVAWQFVRKGIIRIAQEEFKGRKSDDIQLSAITAGAEDIQAEDKGLTIITAPDQLTVVQHALIATGLAITESDLTYLPKTPLTLSDEDCAKVASLEDALNEYPDVVAVFTNIV